MVGPDVLVGEKFPDLVIPTLLATKGEKIKINIECIDSTDTMDLY